MAITSAIMQVRRGLEADFDPEKMKPGEWAVSTDKQYVRMCFSPGVCVRMATYDAFEKDMEQIEEILSTCETIEEAVSKINTEVSANAKAVAEYTEQAKKYRDEAKAFRDEAENIVGIGVATKDKAGIVKPDGTTITVDEDGTIHASEGTTDYEDLANKPQIEGVELSGNKSLSDFGIASATDLQKVETKVDTIIEKAELNIKNSASGENIHLTDSASSKVVEFGLYGKATQDGEPTPDNPIEIVVSGSDGSVEVVSCEKNLLKNTATSRTVNGITYTINESNGSITANGTATSLSTITVGDITSDKNQDIVLSGCPSGGANDRYGFQMYNFTTNKYVATDYGNGAFYKLEPNNVYKPLFYIRSGITVENITFKPMIRLASDTDDTFEPYKETVSTIPTPNGLCGIKVSSGGNYTDENGQQWICDEVVKYADGSGKRVQRLYKKVFNGTETLYLSSTAGGGYYFIYYDSKVAKGTSNAVLDDAMCNRLQRQTADNLWGFSDLTGYSLAEGSIRFRFTSLGITTEEELKSKLLEWNTEEKPLVVWTKLTEPIITDLTAEEIAEIEKLYTFYPITNISNDSDCGMAVTYMADAKNYIDNRLALLETALVNSI